MAKQKNQIEEIEAPVEGAETFQELEQDTTLDTPQQKSQSQPTPEKRETKQVATQPDSFTLEVLKSFPANESLYVDKHGGAFTADTPKSIRGGAVLYKNPFYKR
jgi:hypothetical protein